MSSFTDSLEVVLKHEGGYAFNPADPGGETKYGISKKQYPDVNIHGLTVADAGVIYKRDYWDANKLGELTNQRIANAVMDAIVNHGQGVRIVQTALNMAGKTVKVDNAMGSKTRQALNSVNEKLFLTHYVMARKEYYDSLITKNPELATFKRGWYKRADFFLPMNGIAVGGMGAMILGIAAFLYLRKK